MALRLRTVLGLGGAAALAGGIALSGLSEVKAQSSVGTPGFSFRWNNTKDFKKLYYVISNQERDTWSDYTLILKGKDRKAAIIKLDVTVPSYFDTTINPKEVALKYCSVGSALSRTRCKGNDPGHRGAGQRWQNPGDLPGQPSSSQQSHRRGFPRLQPRQRHVSVQCPGSSPWRCAHGWLFGQLGD